MVPKSFNQIMTTTPKNNVKNVDKMTSLLDSTFGGLLAPLGPLLGGSWPSLGRPRASKMGSKRVSNIGIRVFVIPSCCFFRFFSLRSASGSPLGRVLAPSWRHLGPSWTLFCQFWRFFKDFWWVWGSIMD